MCQKFLDHSFIQFNSINIIMFHKTEIRIGIIQLVFIAIGYDVNGMRLQLLLLLLLLRMTLTFNFLSLVLLQALISTKEVVVSFISVAPLLLPFFDSLTLARALPSAH